MARYDFVRTFPQPLNGEIERKALRAGHAKIEAELRGYYASVCRLDAGTIITTGTTGRKARARPGPEAERALLVSMIDSTFSQYQRHFGATARAAFEAFVKGE